MTPRLVLNAHERQARGRGAVALSSPTFGQALKNEEAQRYLRRSRMSAESKSRAINRYGLQNYLPIPW